MITRDFMMRQIHMLTQALSQVLFNKRNEHLAEAQEEIGRAVREASGVSLDALHALDRDALVAVCSPGGAFEPRLAVALAGLLAEDREEEGRRRALWLYEELLRRGAPVPFGVDEIMDGLRGSLA